MTAGIDFIKSVNFVKAKEMHTRVETHLTDSNFLSKPRNIHLRRYEGIIEYKNAMDAHIFRKLSIGWFFVLQGVLVGAFNACSAIFKEMNSFSE